MHAGTFHKGLLHPKHWLTWLVLILVWLFTCLPVSLRRGIMYPVGRKSLFASKGRERAVKANLNICFPNLNHAEKQAMLMQHANYSGFAISEIAWMWFRSLKRIQQRTRIEGIEHLHKAKADNRPVIYLIPHMFWLEYGAFALGQEYPIAGIFNTFKNPVLDWLVGMKRAQLSKNPIRRQSGGTISQVIGLVNDGVAVHHLMDEDLGAKRSVFAPYFGTPKATLANMAEIIQQTQAIVLPCTTRYEIGEDKMVINIDAALDWNEYADDPVAIAEQVNLAYEKMVRISPEQYMWNLRYFRNRPEGDDREFYKGDIKWD